MRLAVRSTTRCQEYVPEGGPRVDPEALSDSTLAQCQVVDVVRPRHSRDKDLFDQRRAEHRGGADDDQHGHVVGQRDRQLRVESVLGEQPGRSVRSPVFTVRPGVEHYQASTGDVLVIVELDTRDGSGACHIVQAEQRVNLRSDRWVGDHRSAVKLGDQVEQLHLGCRLVRRRPGRSRLRERSSEPGRRVSPRLEQAGGRFAPVPLAAHSGCAV